jgi:hypothetical protein
MKHFGVKMANENRFLAPHPESAIKRPALYFSRFYCLFPLGNRLGLSYAFRRLGQASLWLWCDARSLFVGQMHE